MFFLTHEILKNIFIKLLLFAVVGIVSSLNAVDYGGEKSYMIKLPYKACTVSPIPREALEAGIIPINTAKAKKFFIEGALFYDARKKSDYNKAHIKDAKPIIFDDSKAKYTVISLPKSLDKNMIFYCYGDSCASSYEAALSVLKHGYKNVFWYVNGFDDWKKKGYPVESSKLND
jgi:rhodanese-related sulfurtransferase